MLTVIISKEHKVRAAIMCGLSAGRTAKEFADFNNIPLSIVYTVN